MNTQDVHSDQVLQFFEKIRYEEYPADTSVAEAFQLHQPRSLVWTCPYTFFFGIACKYSWQCRSSMMEIHSDATFLAGCDLTNLKN